MVNPEPLSRTLEYRGRSLRVSRTDKQWLVEIVATSADPDSQVLRGWDEEEVLRRAKLRVDDMHERRHP
jgi:hypothetical protein